MIITVGKGVAKVNHFPNAQEFLPPPQREVPEQLNQMDAALGRLLEALVTLEDRLNPVLRPVPEQPDGCTAKPAQASRFGDVLQSFNARSQSLTDRIADLERRTEL